MGEIEKKYLVVAKEIADNLIKKGQFKNNGLFSGKMGAIIYLYICHKHLNINEYKLIADEWIIEIVNDTITYSDLSLCEGSTGIAWGIEFLNKNGFVNADIDYLLDDFDYHLMTSIENDFSIDFNDLLYGFVGKGVYFLEKNSLNESILKSVINQIYKSAHLLNESALAWISKRHNEPEKIDFGIAHGSLGIMAFLAQCRKQNKFDNYSIDLLLKNAVEFVLINRNEESESSSLFPSWIGVDNNISLKSSRLAWCYGDLGVAYVLLEIGLVLEDRELIDVAIDICKKTTKRKSKAETSVEDLHLCHGTSGIALIYHIIYEKTQIKLFQETSEYWIEQTLIIYNNSIRDKSESLDINEFGLLSGMTGVGLSILTCNNTNVEKWYKSLLL